MGSVAEWYDLLNPWDACDDFYLDLVMRAERVLDIGCGTGALLHRARERGHRGHLVGIDPDADMLDVARRRTDIEWRLGTAATLPHVEADLIVMTGHAFQTLVDDAELTASLASIRDALSASGRFAFETRNPRVEPWRDWDEEFTVADDSGEALTVTREVLSVDGQIVTFDETFSSPVLLNNTTVRSTLRFLPPDQLVAHLVAAGLEVDIQYGDWDRGPLMSDSREIVTIASRSIAM